MMPGGGRTAAGRAYGFNSQQHVSPAPLESRREGATRRLCTSHPADSSETEPSPSCRRSCLYKRLPRLRERYQRRSGPGHAEPCRSRRSAGPAPERGRAHLRVGGGAGRSEGWPATTAASLASARTAEAVAAVVVAVADVTSGRPVLYRKALCERRRGSGCFLYPSVACRGAGELCRSLAPQLGGHASPGRRKEEPGAEPLPPTGSQQPVSEDTAPLPPAQPGGTGLKFGLLTPELHAHVLGQEDYRKRTQAVEELKRVIEDASQAAVTSVPAPSILGFIGLLCTLLGDLNFKVVLGALEVIYLLALRLDNQVNAFLTALFSAATKVLGDSKPAIRQGYNRLLQWLMKAVGPQQVLDLLLQQEYRQHKNSRVREEVVSMCIVALLTYSSEELDLAKLAFELAPALVDNKHRVRHAAMEAFAVLASAMGPGKTTLLFKAVDAMELEDNGDGLMHAVQARLARKILPKLADQGFVQYAVPLPSSGYSRASCLPPGADTDWLLMCDRIRSAHSYCGYKVGVDALQDSSSHSVGANQVACSRKVWSAFKEKNKLPWEKEHAEDREVGSGVKMHVTKGVEQVCTCTSLDSCVLKDVPKGDVKIVKGLLSDWRSSGVWGGQHFPATSRAEARPENCQMSVVSQSDFTKKNVGQAEIAVLIDLSFVFYH
ncbi:TOG array regulator of axonemal microtubules protein 1-like [Amazona ochrocephala]